MVKRLIQKILEYYVKKYLETHKIKLVAVVGSVGKTSTKLAIATVLAEKYRVRTQEGNHNTHLSAPLAILGIEYPDNIYSPLQWMAVFKAADIRLKEIRDVDVIVQELGTDRPGDMAVFGRYLNPDITVVTSVGLEHMENFHDIEAVAREELSVAKFSKLTIVNRDDVNQKFAPFAQTDSISTYGMTPRAEYYIRLGSQLQIHGNSGMFVSPDWDNIPVTLQLVGEHSIKAAAAAGAVGAKLELSAQDIAIGMAKIRAVKGRMNILQGMNGSILIDDSYNSSPMAVSAALKTLYSIESPQRIAILGSMNEFGSISQKAHEAVGTLCKPEYLDWVVTVGDEAGKYIAPMAHKNGCQVRSYQSAIVAGGFVHSVIKQGAVVLIKGSQNNVFTEEAVKVLLHDSADEEKLVRQSQAWMKIKQKFFDKTVESDDD